MRRSLVEIKDSPELRAELEGQQAYIWSGEWRAYWRPDYCGYTYNKGEAGIYDFEDAFNHTKHCGEEKRIVYEVVDSAGRGDFLDCLAQSGV